MNTASHTHPLAQTRSALALRAKRGYREVTTHRYGLIALSLTRIGYGVGLFALLALNLPVREQLWGPSSAYSLEAFARFTETNNLPSLYLLSDSSTYAAMLYFATMAAALAFALGWRTRAVTVVLLVLVWSLHSRNSLVTNGGDNLVRIVLIYLCLATTNAYFSLDARRARARGRELRRNVTAPAVATVVHNAALALSIFQVCVLYLAAGMFKIQGEAWQEGTAVYYVMRTADYNPWPEISALLYTFPLIIVAASYASVFFQVAMPFSLLNSHAKHVVMLGLLGMHTGIAILMGLPLFSLFMIASDLLVFSDTEYRRMGALAQRWLPRRDALRPHQPDTAPSPDMIKVPCLPAAPVPVLTLQAATAPATPTLVAQS